MTVVTIANGGDNIASYVPLFATRSGGEVALMGLVFLAMSGVWCVAARWLVAHRTVGAPVRRYGRGALPYVLIGLGLMILWRSGTFALIGSSG